MIILDPQADCPAGQVADDQIVAAYDDQAQIMMLAQRVDVLTYEFENVDAKTIEAAENIHGFLKDEGATDCSRPIVGETISC
ncbi:hypothetical protein [Latilactobacillus curvatus]|uniref:hypothetical protein n=1 Tax=Latilactobacillus curvatus TaxID=28038 RepID=UPI0020A55070|nr:hypothetical protein [Latilactobacillus curvatus]